jgi:hypothetical protein
MQTTKQLSVSLVNKPGRLAEVLSTLNRGKVTLRALTVMDIGDRGAIRLVPIDDDFEKAKEILDRMNVRHETTEVLLTELPSHTGGFRRICEKLAAEHLNIDYAYCSFNGGGKIGGGVLAVFKVNDPARAQRVLGENTNGRKKTMPFRRLVLSR